MNTERPDNDDAETEAGADETAGGVRDTGDASGGKEEQAADVSQAPEAEEPAQESGAEGAGAPDADEAPADEARAAEAHAEKAHAEKAPAEKAPADEPRAAEAHAEKAHAEKAHADEVRTDEPDADRPARRRTPVVVASVAAAVLLVGGGGAYLAATASGGSGGGTTSGAPSGDGTPPPLALEGYASPSEGGTNGIAPGEPNPYGVTYKADGTLPDGPGSAPVYRAKGEVTKEEVARLAGALGLDGTPVAEGLTWKAGAARDGSGPSLQVDKQAPGTWTFNRYTPGGDNCQKPTVCPQKPEDPGGDPVSADAAMKAAAPVLKAMGQDDAKRDASQVMGAQRVVNADPVVDGLPTYGWSTGLMVSAQGEVVGGSGRLKAPAKGDTYPVLDADKTLQLMNAAPAAGHRMGIGGCASPVPLKDRLEQPCQPSTAAPEKETITVEKAVFGLASHVVEARQALVPSWLFEVRAQGAQDTYTVTYPAIDPKYLASPTPSGQPSPRPSGPGDEPTSAPEPRDVKVEGYSAEGRELTVIFTGGVCADYEAKASESTDKVTVTVTETRWKDKVCILIAKQYQQTVQLDEPLGDREVVGSDGKAVPLHKPGARLPAPPSATR